MKLYRECSEHYETVNCGNQPIADFDSLIFVTVYNSNNILVKNFVMPIQQRDTIDNNTYNICLYAPPGVCVEQATYQENFWLDDLPGGYTVTYERCCRNWEITNIVLPPIPPCDNQPDVGAAWSLTIPDTSQAVCNSSPVFNKYPPTIICWNAPFVYDHSATDADGDSLVYELCTAFEFNNNVYGAAPNPSLPPNYFFPVPYISGYSGAYPIDALPADSFKIDSQTGLLTGTPTDTGVYVVAICVSEYRNGVLLSTNKRDFVFNIAVCLEDANLQFTSAPDSCENFTMYFDYGGKPVASFNWNFGVDTSVTDTSTMENPAYIFPATGIYPVTLIVNEDYSCADTLTKTVFLPGPLVAGYTWQKVCAFDTVKFFDNSDTNAFSGPVTNWEWIFGDGKKDTIQYTSHSYAENKVYSASLIITTSKGCKDTVENPVDFYPLPIVNAGLDVYVSAGEETQLLASGALTYAWSPTIFLNAPDIPNPISNPLETTEYIATGYTAFGCMNEDTIKVIVIDAQIAIPNAFSPNGDNENDIIYIIEVGIMELLEFKIFNRWGQLVFETKDMKTGWDGNFKGVPQETGNYAYYYKAKTLAQDILEGSGDIALIR